MKWTFVFPYPMLWKIYSDQKFNIMHKFIMVVNTCVMILIFSDMIWMLSHAIK